MAKGWPKDFPHGQYKKLNTMDKRNAMRKKHGMVAIGEKSKQAAKRDPAASRGMSSKESKFPRSTAGAAAFIRAWQQSSDGNDFIVKHGDDEGPNFWSACTNRALFLRKHGVALKVLRRARDGRALYDFNLLKAVAAEAAA